MEHQWINTATFLISLSSMFIALFAAFVSYIVYRSQADPEIIIYAQADRKRPSLINLVIENIGKAPAKDVTFIVPSNFPAKAFGIDPKKAKEAKKMIDGPLIRGIPFFPPGGIRTITWGQYGGLLML